MKNYLTSTLLLFFIAAFIPKSDAQILKKLEKKIERKVNQRIDRKTEKAIDKGLDKVEGNIEGRSEKDDNTSVQRSESPEPTSAAPYVSSKFDFIPGDKLLFLDDFALEAKGDFPSKWNTNGSGEIVTLGDREGNWLKIPDNTISFPELNTVLPENFTIEFDLFYPKGTTRPPVTFGFTEVADPAKSSIQHKKLFYFHIPATIKDNVGYSTSLYSGRETTQSWPANKKAGEVVHVSIAVNKSRIRLYMDERKMFDLPKAFESASLRNNFHFRAAPLIPKPNEGFYVSNLRIAEAGLDVRSQLLNKGQFSTSGIYFDVGSSTILPQSYGILKEIAAALGEAPDVKIKIVGHTDNDGGTELNMELSRKRAEAVKRTLEEDFGIGAVRLSAEGKGASDPVAGNDTSEGKASNRRVEFIKI